MAKQITSWKKTGQTTPTVDFDSASVDYDSSTTPYAGNGQSANSEVKQRTSWDKGAKQVTAFSKNPASDTNNLIYDSNNNYDVSLTYDGIVANEPASTTKKPTEWSKE